MTNDKVNRKERSDYNIEDYEIFILSIGLSGGFMLFLLGLSTSNILSTILGSLLTIGAVLNYRS